MSDREVAVVWSPHGYRFDPVERVLQDENPPQGEDQFVRHVGLLGGTGDIQEQGAIVFQHTFHCARPLEGPVEVFLGGTLVVVSGIFDAEIIGGGGNDKIDGFRRKVRQTGNAIPEMEFQPGCRGRLGK